jgi:hypothetical protein
VDDIRPAGAGYNPFLFVETSAACAEQRLSRRRC